MNLKTRGQALAAFLDDRIDELVTDDRSRSDIIADMADAAGITTATVGQILDGDIERPPDERLQGFAEVLDVSVEGLQDLSDEDAGVERSWIATMADKLRGFADGLSEQASQYQSIQRDQSFSDLFWAVDDIFWLADHDQFDGWHYMRDMFVDNSGDMFAITISDGKMFRFPVTLNERDEPTIGEPAQVTMTFTPVERAAMVYRNASGQYEALAILNTAVLNKDGEIDSTALFDTFVDRFQGGERVNFHHLDIEFGTLRHIYRSGVNLWGHFEFDDSDMGRAVAESLATDETGEWGISIEFLYEPDEMEFIQVNGMAVPVYNSGTLHRASVLKSRKACAWFTAIPSVATKERAAMNQQIKSDFVDLVGQDLANKAEEMDDSINNRAVQENMVRREESTDAPTTDPQTIEVDAPLLAAMTESVTASEPWQGLTQTVNDISAQFAEAMQAVTNLTSQLTEATDSMAAEMRSRSESVDAEMAEIKQALGLRNAAKPPAQRVARLAPGAATAQPGVPAEVSKEDLGDLPAQRLAELKARRKRMDRNEMAVA